MATCLLYRCKYVFRVVSMLNESVHCAKHCSMQTKNWCYMMISVIQILTNYLITPVALLHVQKTLNSSLNRRLRIYDACISHVLLTWAVRNLTSIKHSFKIPIDDINRTRKSNCAGGSDSLFCSFGRALNSLCCELTSALVWLFQNTVILLRNL